MRLQILPLLLLSVFIPFNSKAETPTNPPEFSHPAGTYENPFGLELSAHEDATVYYTTNGEVPTETSNEFQPGDPVHISGSVMVRARAFREGYDPSKPVTKVFTQLHQNIADFDSNLPLVVVNQFDDVMHPEGLHRSTIYFSVIDLDDDGRARLLSDELHLHSRSESNYRGTSSLTFPKKQFGVRLIDEQDENRNEPILGLPSENNWIMHAPWDDRTLIRNAVAFQLSSDMGRYAPRTRFVELFLHEGDGPVTEDHYHGVYMLLERIKWDDNRVDIEKITPEDNSEPEISGGYIINFDRDIHIRSTSRNTGFALVRPQDWDITSQQRSWIEQYLGDLENALFGANFRDPDDGYAAYLDPESFIDHHLITETLKEMDGYRLSTYLYKDRGERLVMGPVWDYNLSLGNYTTTEGWNGHDPTGWYYTHVDPEDQYLNGWYTRLFQDPDFEERYRERWWELRQGAFSSDHIVNMIHDYVDKLDEAIDRNFERWDILGDDVWEWSRDGFDTYEEEIDYMVNWIETRLEWIDTQMGEPPADLSDETQLRYFWYFGDKMLNNTPFETIDASFSLVDNARIRFHSALDGYPFHEDHDLWRKASMERRNQPTDINYREKGNEGRPFNWNAMRALQVRQPFRGDAGENTMIFELPTTGMDSPVFRFAAMDEGAAEELVIDYSVADQSGLNKTDSDADSSNRTTGEPEWTTEGIGDGRFSLGQEYQEYKVDFRGIESVTDNPDFKVRIRFDGDIIDDDRGNRVTFNNFSFEDDDSEPVSASYDDEQKPGTVRLEQNYPNPFNSTTVIRYHLPESGNVTLDVYDVLGQRVKTLVNEQLAAGSHEVTLDAGRLSSGVYLYRLEAGSGSITKSMLLVK
ncbi:CotH kinase family protein [Natronogracilivirga saccharolytica]|uniref:CotH kinase family protein n=1 Tax=Natronogracilivirga saccharolytica TaxID=2812953 RepID=A0A8J7RNT7_9BACT|nr:CotH kinase family protein [Natronogracilivirga saccharolytica]MBP3191084.1 CotH kinase family protein [Natronogracilivirga saccharolytica]